METKTTRPQGRPPIPFDDRLKLNEATGCKEWTGVRVRGGYGQVKHCGKMVYAHRVAYERANGAIPEGMFVLHKCDNPPCCNPDHLFIGTLKDNSQDKMRKGRAPDYTGHRNPAAKMTPHSVRRIRALCSEGMKQKDVAHVFGITQAAVSLIVRRVKWRHII